MLVLQNFNFNEEILALQSSSTTGGQLIDKFKAKALNQPITVMDVNRLLKESSVVISYDTLLQESLERISAYIQDNSISWALATHCETILSSTSNKDYLNKSAAKKVMGLLENNEEEELLKIIRSGGLKDVMYCEAFRGVVKNVFAAPKNNIKPVVVTESEYTSFTPVGFVEKDFSQGITYQYFNGQTFKLFEDGKIETIKGFVKEVTPTFKLINHFIDSSDQYTMEMNNTLNFPFKEGVSFQIDKDGILYKNNTEMSIEEFRDQARLIVQTTHPLHKQKTEYFLECIATIVENYSTGMMLMDNINVISINSTGDSILIVENGTTLYSKDINFKRKRNWEVNESALKVLDYLRSSIGIEVKGYEHLVKQLIAENSNEEIAITEARNEQSNIRTRIEALTKKFKNDPVKLALLTKLAQEANS